MSGYGVREARINQERKPRVNLCGDCGRECDALFCDSCEKLENLEQEPAVEQERRRV